MFGDAAGDGENWFTAGVCNFDLAIGRNFAGTVGNHHQVTASANGLVLRIVEVGKVHSDPIPR